MLGLGFLTSYGRATTALLALALLGELVLCLLIIARVPYTEIDWTAYMEQVETVAGGERDYVEIRGGTGPLVYPAGFVWLFTALRALTGGSVAAAQPYWALLYVLALVPVFLLAARTRMLPPYAVLLVCLSKRMHSIFVLRLFNDCWEAAAALWMVYALTFANRAASAARAPRPSWPAFLLASTLLTVAVSIKMNALLFAPAVLLLLIILGGPLVTVVCLAWCALFQVLVGLPFLLAHPWSYVEKSFELSRVFFYKWTVNFRFLPEDVFLDKRLAVLLLALHVGLLGLFAFYRWLPDVRRNMGRGAAEYAAIARALFTANFIGICCARSLHYQFYVWYGWTVPFLLWSTPFPPPVNVVLLAVLEYCWNVYPSTPLSSALLHLVHIAVLGGLWVRGGQALHGAKGKKSKRS